MWTSIAPDYCFWNYKRQKQNRDFETVRARIRYGEKDESTRRR